MSADLDVLVAYYAIFNRDLLINWLRVGGGFGFDRNLSGSAWAEEMWIGTVAVNMMDAKTRSLIWRGIARKEVDVKTSPEKRDKEINKAAEKLTRQG